MMLPIRIGKDLDTNQNTLIQPEQLRRHTHVVGATGTGKTVALHALLRPIMKEPRRRRAMFIIDPLGGLSRDLLMWIASPKCPNHVRERLVYLEAANEDVVMPFNPLESAVGDGIYYHVARTVDLILRAWSAQDLAQQPRLMQWSYAAITAIAEMGLPISLCEYLLHPGTEEHKALLRKLPDRCRGRWMEILNAKGEATRILESTRNRFDPIYSACQTRRMFGVTANRFDVERFIRERRIVIVNVSKGGKVTQMLGNTIGSLMLNEIFETAFRMSSTLGPKSVDPTMIVLDEFQKFIGPDIEDALPTVRQAGLQLVLAHQSFSQLEQGDLDLRSMIWQAQSRLMFANSAEDADIIANELAILKYDPRLVKDAIYQRKQLIAGHRTQWMRSEGVSETTGDSTGSQSSLGFNKSSSTSRDANRQIQGYSEGDGSSTARTIGESQSNGHSVTSNQSEQLVPIYENLRELSSINYVSFDEQRLEWMKTIRTLKQGHCFCKLVDDDRLRRVLIDYSPVKETARAEERRRELLQRNYEQDMFISREEADRLTEQSRQQLLLPPGIALSNHGKLPGPDDVQSSSADAAPFRRHSGDKE